MEQIGGIHHDRDISLVLEMQRPRSNYSGLYPMLRTLVSPVNYLIGVNVICAGLGFIKDLVAARVLGPENYGIIAVLVGTNATLLNFLDVRFGDLAAKLYYRQNSTDNINFRNYRASVLQISLLGNGLISLALGILGLVVSVLTIRFFTAASVSIQWMAAQALVAALLHWTSSFSFLQRFTGKFYVIGTWRILTELVVVGTFLPIMIVSGTLDGYYQGVLLATSVGAGMVIALSTFLWMRFERLPLLRKGILSALPEYRREFRLLLFGNLLGYTKMFHRAADTLLVGYFCDDRTTGLYKLARSLTDGLYVVFDALNQVYYPRFLQLLSERAHDEYRRTARYILSRAGVFTGVLLALEAIFLAPIVKIVLADRFAGIESAIVTLTLPFFFVAGMYLWIWPALVYLGDLSTYTAYSYVACVVQYGVSGALFVVFGSTVLGGAVGYVAYYCALGPAAFSLVRRCYPDVVPGRRLETTSA